ncbi:galactokinase [Pseudoalteromonas sp. MMG005]|uniref:galactokinase n=1 Tax=Pseudoalteromonas sp. MMG005 TaxID=2822682 RepID=UPI001B3A69BA|nr:galactokinase [Pseudoalteromonas sp. MMG005]MBQ4846682.1 galactokinase [Pseudoalteromonas sp. MMG005]
MSHVEAKTKALFTEIFESAPQLTTIAPGRVNLIGEHTDYNDGYVLPCAINFHVVACASPRHDNKVRVISANHHNEIDEFQLSNNIAPSNKLWANYVRGVVQHIRLLGHNISGVDMVIYGDVPQGAGLSSSAALEVSIVSSFDQLYSLHLSDTDIALIAQQAENQFVGCQCGIMDQLISTNAKEGKASLIDCRSMQTKYVSLPDNFSLLIVNSNRKRGLVDSKYNERRAQCEQAANKLGLSALRDISLADFNRQQHILDPIIAKRARHVISENERVIEFVEAMADQDIHSMQRLMKQSHESMRDDFENTVPEIDSLVNIIKSEIGDKGGVRMTGGGFGGCVIALLPTDYVDWITSVINSKYMTTTGLIPTIFVCSAVQGVHSKHTHIAHFTSCLGS